MRADPSYTVTGYLNRWFPQWQPWRLDTRRQRWYSAAVNRTHRWEVMTVIATGGQIEYRRASTGELICWKKSRYNARLHHPPGRDRKMAKKGPDPTGTRHIMPFVFKRVGELIRQAREAKFPSHTQAYFAKLCELSPGYLSMIESGRTQPSLPTLYMIAERLHLNPWDLLPTLEEVRAANQQPCLLCHGKGGIGSSIPGAIGYRTCEACRGTGSVPKFTPDPKTVAQITSQMEQLGLLAQKQAGRPKKWRA